METNFWHTDETHVDETTTQELESEALFLSEKKSNKQRKRKWREIESVKETHRLRRELDDYYQYSF